MKPGTWCMGFGLGSALASVITGDLLWIALGLVAVVVDLLLVGLDGRWTR